MQEDTAVPRVTFGAADPFQQFAEKFTQHSGGAADPSRDKPGSSSGSLTRIPSLNLADFAPKFDALADFGRSPGSPRLTDLDFGRPSASPTSAEPREPGRPSRTIKIYVRKGAHNEQRIVSFNRSGIPATDLMQIGIAIDGTHAALAVSGVQYSSDGDQFHWSYEGPFLDRNSAVQSLPEALLVAEKGLIAFLEERGFTVEFA